MKRSMKITIAGAVCVLGFTALLMINGIVNYIQGVGEIAVNDCEAAPNSTVSIGQIAVWENVKGVYITNARWSDGSKSCIKIADDGQSLEIGDKTGEITAYVCAESRSPEAQGAEAKITVRKP